MHPLQAPVGASITELLASFLLLSSIWQLPESLLQLITHLQTACIHLREAFI